MNKFPCVGRSKTRLGKSVGYEESAYVAKLLLEDFVDKASDVCDVVVSTPRSDVHKFAKKYPDFDVYGRNEDLMKGLVETIRDSYVDNSGKFVAVTGDVIVSKNDISSWFDDLSKYDLSIGPTRDWSFYRIGFSEKFGTNFIGTNPEKLDSRYFSNVFWKLFSHFPKINIGTAKRDIDNIEDLRKEINSESLSKKAKKYFESLVYKNSRFENFINES